MDIKLLEELINTMGFPIVMVGYFIWDKTKVTNRLTRVIENNNCILNRLIAKLGVEEITDEIAEVEKKKKNE